MMWTRSQGEPPCQTLSPVIFTQALSAKAVMLHFDWGMTQMIFLTPSK